MISTENTVLSSASNPSELRRQGICLQMRSVLTKVAAVAHMVGVAALMTLAAALLLVATMTTGGVCFVFCDNLDSVLGQKLENGIRHSKEIYAKGVEQAAQAKKCFEQAKQARVPV